MYLCPKHKVQMTVDYKEFNIFGKIYTSKVAVCPQCKTIYVGDNFIMNTPTFIIDNIRYQYLASLDDAKSNNSAGSTTFTSKPKIHKQKRRKEIKNYSRKEAETAKKAVDEEKKILKERASSKHKDQVVQETYDRLKADDYSFYHAKQVIFNTENLRYCKYDDEELLFVQRVKVEYENKELKTNGYCCLRCGTLYVNNPKAFIAKTQNSKKQETSLVPKSEPQLPKPNIKNSLIKTELNFCDRENILYICKGIISCKNKNHDIESVTGILENKLGSSVKINANYCKQCEKCFIDYTEYLHYKKLYGAIMGNFRISNNGHWDGLFNNLSEESLLHLCGYTVNQNDDLSTKQRRRILEFLINRKMMSKPEIISHLDFLIRTNGKRKNMTVAVSRWNEDIDWIRNYQLDSQRQVTIGRIKKNY